MRRRDFISILRGGAVAGLIAWPMAARAQGATKEKHAHGDRVATKIEVIPPRGKPKNIETAGPDETVGDVFVTWSDGRRERLTRGAHADDAKLGPDGLLGWVWGTERYRDGWVLSYLRIQRGKSRLHDIKAEYAIIEEWAFAPEGLIVKSRGAHGPARIELFALGDGRRLQLIEKAYREDDDAHLPPWAKPYADE